MSEPVRVPYGETTLEQHASGVLVIFADGSTRLVLNARVSEDMSEAAKVKIIIAARRPA